MNAFRHPFAALCLMGSALLSLPALADSRLTEQERQWIAASEPALHSALRLGLPIRVSVQPTSGAGFSPLSLGFDQGVCRFVVSLRDNPAVEASFLGAPAHERPLLITLMAFHEIAHCWRHAQGLWGSSPSGLALDSERAHTSEEAFADLAALAWVWREAPDQAPAAQAWLEAVRSNAPLSAGRHGTLPWIRLARSNFSGFSGATPLELARSAWASIR